MSCGRKRNLQMAPMTRGVANHVFVLNNFTECTASKIVKNTTLTMAAGFEGE
jgi:hypothetical protein